MEALRRAGLLVPLPDLETDLEKEVAHVLHECGMARNSGMGPCPISASELRDWIWGTGADLPQWAFALVLKASRSFVTGCGADEPPYQPTLTRMALASAEIEGL